MPGGWTQKWGEATAAVRRGSSGRSASGVAPAMSAESTERQRPRLAMTDVSDEASGSAAWREASTSGM